MSMIRALVDLLGNHYHAGNLHHVEAIARSILAAIPDDCVSLQFLGLIHYRNGRVAEAIRTFDKVRHRASRRSETELRLGEGYLSRGDYAAAAKCYREATRLNPHLAEAWRDLGVALGELGEWDQAVGAFRAALAAAPGSREAFAGLGAAGLRAGDLAAAEEGYAGVLAIDPDDTAAACGLTQVRRRRRNPDTAAG